MRNYRSDVVPIKVLPSDTITRMAKLYLENYEGTSEAQRMVISGTVLR